jgi:hypothetical protein
MKKSNATSQPFLGIYHERISQFYWRASAVDGFSRCSLSDNLRLDYSGRNNNTTGPDPREQRHVEDKAANSLVLHYTTNAQCAYSSSDVSITDQLSPWELHYYYTCTGFAGLVLLALVPAVGTAIAGFDWTHPFWSLYTDACSVLQDWLHTFAAYNSYVTDAIKTWYYMRYVPLSFCNLHWCPLLELQLRALTRSLPSDLCKRTKLAANIPTLLKLHHGRR